MGSGQLSMYCCYEFECFEETSLQTKLNAGLSEQQEEDLFQNERSFHEVNSKQHVLNKLTRPPPT